MMQIWIVWKAEPVASFSSEARARRFIALQARPQEWRCYATELNPASGDLASGHTALPDPGARRSARMTH